MRSWKSCLRALPFASSLLLLLTSGCGKFFVPETSSGGGGTSTGNYLYVADAAVSTIAGFSIGTSGLSNAPNSPYTLGVAPSAMAITPSNGLLYVGSLAGAIYAYSIASTGALTIENNGSAVVSQVSPLAMRIDTTGGWLIAVDATPAAYLFSINASTGALTAEGSVPLDAGAPNRIVFTPDNSKVYISLGTGGVDILTFSASTGKLTKTSQILKPKQSGFADQGMAVDPSSTYLYVAETGTNGVRAFSILASGGLTELTGSPYTTGLGPNGVLVDSTGSYVYVANRTDGTVSGFTLGTTGTLTAMSGSPFATGSAPVEMAEDMTGAYIAVACSGGSPDLQVFTIGTTGALTSFATTNTGTDPTSAFTVVATNK